MNGFKEARFSLCPVWLHFHATARLCWGGLGFVGWDLVSPNQKLQRDISRALTLWPLPLPIFTSSFFFFLFWTCTFFSRCKYFPACVHRLSLFAWSCSILVDELRAKQSSASAHMRWKLCGRWLPICFAIPGYSSNLCTVCSLRCAESSTFQEEGTKWKPVFQHLEQRWLLAILCTFPMRLIACTTDCSMSPQQAVWRLPSLWTVHFPASSNDQPFSSPAEQFPF